MTAGAAKRKPRSRQPLTAEITVTYVPLPPERRAEWEWAMRYLYGRLAELAIKAMNEGDMQDGSSISGI